MSKLTEIFEGLKNYLHHGPSMEPFHRAVIMAHEKIEDDCNKLRKEFDALKARLELMFPERTAALPQYISPPVSIMVEGLVEAPAVDAAQTQAAAVQAISAPVPDDPASLVEAPETISAPDAASTNAAEPMSDSTSSPPSAAADTASAAPDPAEAGITPDSVSLQVQPEPSSAGPDTTAAAPQEVVPAPDTAAPAASSEGA